MVGFVFVYLGVSLMQNKKVPKTMKGLRVVCTRVFVLFLLLWSIGILSFLPLSLVQLPVKAPLLHLSPQWALKFVPAQEQMEGVFRWAISPRRLLWDMQKTFMSIENELMPGLNKMCLWSAIVSRSLLKWLLKHKNGRNSDILVA